MFEALEAVLLFSLRVADFLDFVFALRFLIGMCRLFVFACVFFFFFFVFLDQFFLWLAHVGDYLDFV